jgi:hypothetical protein
VYVCKQRLGYALMCRDGAGAAPHTPSHSHGRTGKLLTGRLTATTRRDDDNDVDGESATSWSQSPKAAPSSRPRTGRSHRSPSSVFDGRISQRPTHASAQCPQSWVRPHRWIAAHGEEAVMERAWANSSVTGCWASSGYSMQACALLEQKLRQCMDAPVRSLAPRLRPSMPFLTMPPARPQPEEEQHQLPSLEDVPQDCRPPQAQIVCPPPILLVHYPYPRDGNRMK